jgi:ribonuclease inhibitor
MTAITLDGRRMKTRDGTHAYLARKLALPAYYGGNLDALHDCLSEMSGIAITLRYSHAMRKRLGAYGDVLCEVLLSAAQENSGLEIRLL